MKRVLLVSFVFVCIALIFTGFRLYQISERYSHLIAVSWGDSKYAPALYGAYVFTEAAQNGRMARAIIYIDRPAFWLSTQHSPVDLGPVTDDTEAVARWRDITWSDEGVRFGSGQGSVLIKRAQLEAHR